MHQYKSTYNILTRPDEDEAFESKWMEYPWIVDPPTKDWDYKREMKIEDVDIWEVLAEGSGGVGVYAAWTPYAEFYMVTTGWKPKTICDRIIETYYGPGSQDKVFKRAKEIGLDLKIHNTWVDEHSLWQFKDVGNSIYSENKD